MEEREREDSLNEMGREDFSEGREGSRRKNKSTELLKKSRKKENKQKQKSKFDLIKKIGAVASLRFDGS